MLNPTNFNFVTMPNPKGFIFVFTILVAVFAVLLTWRQMSAGDSISGAPAYEAPLREDNSGLKVIPKCYHIELFPGHSIRDLSTAISQDVQPYVSHVFEKLFLEDGEVLFVVEGVEDELLAAIRAYRGVKLINRDYVPEFDEI